MTAAAHRPGSARTRRRRIHARFAGAATLLALGAGVLAPTPSITTQAALAAGAVLALGFPHGALDPLVALMRVPAGARLALLLTAYLGLAVAVVALWSLSPLAGLALFLATSALHFGLGDAPAVEGESPGSRALRIVAHGAAPIVLPSALHPDAAGLVYGWVLGDGASTGAAGERATAWLASASGPLVGGWALLALFAIARSGGARARAAAELVLLAATFALLPPLLSFAIYFCVWHSARHLIDVDVELGATSRRRALACAGAVLAATAVLLGVLHATSAHPRSIEAVTRTVFVALAALTPPHMIVTEILRRASGIEGSTPREGRTAEHA